MQSSLQTRPASNGMNRKLKYIYIVAIAMLPMVAFAFGNLKELLDYFTGLIYFSVRPLLIAIAIAWFLWGMAMYIRESGDETKRAEGRFFMLWSVIALFVIFAVWGLVGILADTFQVNTGIPGAPSSGGSQSLPSPQLTPVNLQRTI